MTKSASGTLEKNGVNVAQKRGLNRSILENNWGQLKQFVQYKSDMYGKHFVLVNPKNTSSKCSICGHIEKDNRIGKLFHCLDCGHKMDADLNASINIKEAGLALFACGGLSSELDTFQEQLDPPKQELEKKLKA